MSRHHWYKRYPADFIEGVVGLSLEEKGAYSIVLDLIYARGRPIPDDPRYIAGVCGCSVRKWNAIKGALIAAGKIIVSDGLISNPRANSEIGSLEKSGDNPAKSCGKSENNSEIISRKNRDKNAEKTSDPFEINGLENERLAYARVKDTEADTETDNNPPLPPVEESKAAAPEREIGEWSQLMIDIKSAFEAVGSMNLRPDTDYVGVWRELGYRPPIILAEIKSTLARKPHVNTLKYFNNQIREAHEKAAKQPAAPAPMDEGKRLNFLRSMVQEWQREPTSWPPRLGPRPGESGCTVPANILAEFGIQPRERRAA